MADTNTVHVGGTVAAPHHPSVEARFVSVEGDVRGLKSDIGAIKTAMVDGFKDVGLQVKEIGAQVTSARSPNLHLIGLCAAVVVPLAGWGWSQLSNVQLHLEKATEQFVSRSDIQDKFAAAKEIADLKAQIVQKDVTRLAEDVKDIQSKIVPLSTHQELWAKQADTNKGILAQVDENRRSIADITAPKDTISRIDRRLEELERTRARGASRSE